MHYESGVVDHHDGDRQSIVLLHGTGGQVDHWQGLVDRIRARGLEARIVTVEFRGHGQSDASAADFTVDDLARDVACLIEQIAPDCTAIIGHSLGGMVALAGESLWPADTELVLIEGWTRLACAARCGPRHMWGHLAAESIAATQADWQRNVGRFDPDLWKRFWSSVEQADARNVLASTRRRVLSIYGGLDLPAPVLDTMEIPARDHLPLAIVDDAGHYTHFEQPDHVAQVVVDFMSSR